MRYQTEDQLKHDRINLTRLVRRLETQISPEKWQATDDAQKSILFVKVLSTQQVSWNPFKLIYLYVQFHLP
jgi:hypothetical protein